MDNRPLPYQAIGPFVLFRKLEEGHLADLWRGAPLTGPSRGEPMAIHRFKAGDPIALRNAAASARERLRETAGATIVRNQTIEAVGSTTLLVHEYSGGRSLRGIVERASRPASPHPIPVDQAIAIAERISASLQALHGFRAGGARLVHGAVIPQFVWITEDGEIRLAGQHLASGVIASVKDPRVRGEIGAFLAPEIHAGGEPSVAGDVFSVGAILHLALTGKLPALQTTSEGLATALDAATIQFDDEPFPPALRAILERTLAPEPAQRFSSFDELHQTLTRLATGGEYAPTTFNLAFYLHTLMKKEREEETEERRREEAADVAAIAARASEEARAAAAAPQPVTSPGATTAPPAPAAAPPPVVLSQPATARSRAPLFAAAAIVAVAALGGGGYAILRGRGAEPAKVPPSLAAAALAPRPQTPPAAAPVLTAIADPAAPTETAAQTASAAPQESPEEAARRKAFEEEVNRRLQAEVARLQQDYEKQLAAERAKAAPRPAPEQTARATPATPPAAPASTATAVDLSAADRLNQQRLEQLRERSGEPEPAAPAVDTASAAPRVDPLVTETVAQPAAPAVREGDLVELGDLDKQPSLVRSVPPVYPPVARQQKLGATIIVTALISETGDVAEVRVLRGDARNMGFNEAAVQAMRKAKFSPAMKDGKRVRTWLAMPVNFQPR